MKKFQYNGMEFTLKFLGVVGSNLHGVNVKDSDVDYKGVFTWNTDLLFGMKNLPTSLDKKNTDKDEWNNLLYQLNKEFNLNLKEDDDLVLYDAKSFFDLSFKNDLNMFDMLYSSKEFVLYTTQAFENVRFNKDKFVNPYLASNRFFGMSTTYFNDAKNNKGNVNKNYSKALQTLFSLEFLLKNNYYSCSLDNDKKDYLLNVRNGNYSLEEYFKTLENLKNELNSLTLDKLYNARSVHFDFMNQLLVDLYKEF